MGTISDGSVRAVARAGEHREALVLCGSQEIGGWSVVTLAEWSATDDESQPGGLYNSERVPSLLGSMFSSMGGVFGAGLTGITTIARRQRTHGIFVRLYEDSVDVSDGKSLRTIPLADVERVVLHKIPVKSGAMVELVMGSGEVIAVPNDLYPDAIGEFPSLRHQRRAREVATALREAARSCPG